MYDCSWGSSSGSAQSWSGGNNSDIGNDEGVVKEDNSFEVPKSTE